MMPVSHSFEDLESFLREAVERQEVCSVAYGISQGGETLL